MLIFLARPVATKTAFTESVKQRGAPLLSPPPGWP